MTTNKTFLYLSGFLSFFLLISFLFPVHKAQADLSNALCDIYVDVNNTTGNVTISGNVEEGNPGQDPSYTTISIYDNYGSGGADNSGGDSVFVQYTRNFPDGSYRADVQGTSESNPLGGSSTCSAFQYFTVARPVNGACSNPQTHYNCSVGSSVNNVSGSTTWTWTCAGLYGGSNASCSENKPTPTGSITASNCSVSSN